MKFLRSSSMTRRRLVAQFGAGAALAPFVPLLEPRSHAAAAAPPKRLIFLYSSNGMTREKWLPTMQGGQLVMSEILKPLERHKADVLVIDGLGYNVTKKGEKDGHYGGMNAALTGSPPKIIDPAEENSLATGPSLDQVVANAIGAQSRFRSLELGIQVDTYAATVAALSYRAALQPIIPENDIYKTVTRVFGNFAPADTSQNKLIEQQRLDRKSAIDFVLSDLKSLRGRLGAHDQTRLDAHLDSVRQLEMALAPAASATQACVPVQPGTKLDYRKNDNIPALGQLSMDLLVMAMACDLTRVGTIQYGRAGAQHRFTWLGSDFLTDPDNGPNDSTSGIHGLAHNEGNPSSRAKLARCHTWYAEQVALLVDKLKAIPEGAGTMADNTLVVWMNEMGTGNHSLQNTPWTLVGRLGGQFKTNRVLAFAGQAHNRLLGNVAQAFIGGDGKFGDPEFGNGPLPGLS
ncbi:MAG: DUF1552 domain-containing protein [Deltaproteobacteria bacterium]|nr:DUF1552 domain-containing protein [Deltaproteobacteria bacterium]